VRAVPLFILAWALAAALFVAASILAGTHETFPGDVWLAQRIQDVESEVFARALDWAEDSADLPIVVLVCAMTITLLLRGRDGLAAVILIIAVLGRVLTTWILKEVIGRPRPSADLLEFTSQPSTLSFPSGHAAAAFVLYGLVFYFASIYVRAAPVRIAIQAACVVLIIAVGLERIYVGHHWPSDVLGGYFHGALIVSAAIAVHQFGRRARPQVTSARHHRFHVRRQHKEQVVGRAREP
jgi:membrane-associated phospholipid phosphatase